MLKNFQLLVFCHTFDQSNEKNLSNTQKCLFGRTVLWNDTPYCRDIEINQCIKTELILNFCSIWPGLFENNRVVFFQLLANCSMQKILLICAKQGHFFKANVLVAVFSESINYPSLERKIQLIKAFIEHLFNKLENMNKKTHFGG